MAFLEYLMKKNLISEILYKELISKKDNIISYLYNNKIIEKNNLILSVKEYFAIEYVNIDFIQYEKQSYEFIDEFTLEKYNILVSDISNTEVTIIISNPLDYLLFEDLNFIVKNKKIIKKFAFSDEIQRKRSDFKKIYLNQNTIKNQLGNEKTKNKETRTIQNSEPSSVVNIVNTIINDGLYKGASDIHIEPIENQVRLRYRIDGELVVYPNFINVNEYENLVSRIKVLSNLDPSEKRKSQDGRISGYSLDNKSFDIRVSSMSTVFGEKIVLRILEDKSSINSLSQLGFNTEEIKVINNIINKSNGIFLVTGETGSGKTTTLYTILNLLNKENINICTVEDPVESIIKGINQVQVNELAQITFQSALKTFLRQDPNIIMVGEIRDFETAEVAVKASSTGHLVLSTIHTNNATATITRLKDIGILPYQVNENLKGILSQKLVKKLCPFCKKEHILTEEETSYITNIENKYSISLLNEDIKFYERGECSFCNHGYKGRILVSEILFINDDIKPMLNKNSNNLRTEIYNKNKNDFIPIEINGLQKAIQGITSVKEIMNKISF